MGKGDKKTKRGKISMGTYGVSRPRTSSNDQTTDDGKDKKSGDKKPAKARSSKK